MTKLLVHVSQRLAGEWKSVGIELDFSYSELTRMERNRSHDLQNAILDMLQTWNSRSRLSPEDKITMLKEVLESDTVGRVDISRSIDDKLEGLALIQKFQFYLLV